MSRPKSENDPGIGPASEGAAESAPSPSFQRRCVEEGVPGGRVHALWRLHCRDKRRRLSPEERLQALFDDHGHWELFRESREGDTRAAADFERHWRSQADRFLRVRFTAQDRDEIASTFFATVYRRVGPSFRWDCPFVSYLKAILVNVSRDHAAGLARRRSRETSLEDPDAAVGASRRRERTAEPEARLLSAETGLRVRRALATLSPADAHVLLSALVHGESSDEIGARLGLSRAAVQQRVSRARKRLRRLLEGEYAP